MDSLDTRFKSTHPDGTGPLPFPSSRLGSGLGMLSLGAEFFRATSAKEAILLVVGSVGGESGDAALCAVDLKLDRLAWRSVNALLHISVEVGSECLRHR